MPANQELREQFSKALQTFHQNFSGDLELIRAKAEDHGIRMTSGGIYLPPTPGAYNLRTPEDDDLDQLLGNSRVLVGCIDARQSAQIWEDIQPDAFIAVAGGAAQPNDTRRSALVDFLATAMTFNPKLNVTLLGHDRKCGGVAHASNGSASAAFVSGGYNAEHDLIGHYLESTVHTLLEKGISPQRITLGYAHVGEEDQF